MKKVIIIHTSPVSLDDLKALCNEIIPDIELVNIIDDSMLEEVKKNNGITPQVISRMCSYVQIAGSFQPDLIFNQCSSVGEAFDIAKNCVDCKTLKIDEAMAEAAVETGVDIAVIATVESTLKPSCHLVETKAREKHKRVTVTPYLVNGALDILMKEHNKEKHNLMVLKKIEEVDQKHDVIVLAQGSMISILPYLKTIQHPVFTSPRLAIERMKILLEKEEK